MNITKEQARFRKNGYLRSARLCKKSGCALRRNDVLRALHYREIQRQITAKQAAAEYEEYERRLKEWD